MKVGVKRTFSDIKQRVDRCELLGIDVGMNVRCESLSGLSSKDLKVLHKASFNTDFINPCIKRRKTDDGHNAVDQPCTPPF